MALLRKFEGSSHGCFCKLEVPFVGVLIVTALLFRFVFGPLTSGYSNIL